MEDEKAELGNNEGGEPQAKPEIDFVGIKGGIGAAAMFGWAMAGFNANWDLVLDVGRTGTDSDTRRTEAAKAGTACYYRT